MAIFVNRNVVTVAADLAALFSISCVRKMLSKGFYIPCVKNMRGVHFTHKSAAAAVVLRLLYSLNCSTGYQSYSML